MYITYTHAIMIHAKIGHEFEADREGVWKQLDERKGGRNVTIKLQFQK